MALPCALGVRQVSPSAHRVLRGAGPPPLLASLHAESHLSGLRAHSAQQGPGSARGGGGRGAAGLALEPAEEQRHGPGVVAEGVAGAGEHPEVGRAVAVGQGPGVDGGDHVVVVPLHEQERPGGERRHGGERADRLQLEE